MTTMIRADARFSITITVFLKLKSKSSEHNIGQCKHHYATRLDYFNCDRNIQEWSTKCRTQNYAQLRFHYYRSGINLTTSFQC